MWAFIGNLLKKIEFKYRALLVLGIIILLILGIIKLIEWLFYFLILGLIIGAILLYRRHSHKINTLLPPEKD
jgi:hypothetical protein